MKACATIGVDAAVLYCGIVKCGTDVCGGITLDVAVPCRKPELYIFLMQFRQVVVLYSKYAAD